MPSSVQEITLSQALYDEANALVQDLAKAGSGDFEDELLQAWADLGLNQYIDEETTDIWEEIQKEKIYLPVIMKW